MLTSRPASSHPVRNESKQILVELVQELLQGDVKLDWVAAVWAGVRGRGGATRSTAPCVGEERRAGLGHTLPAGSPIVGSRTSPVQSDDAVNIASVWGAAPLAATADICDAVKEVTSGVVSQPLHPDTGVSAVREEPSPC